MESTEENVTEREVFSNNHDAISSHETVNENETRLVLEHTDTEETVSIALQEEDDQNGQQVYGYLDTRNATIIFQNPLNGSSPRLFISENEDGNEILFMVSEDGQLLEQSFDPNSVIHQSVVLETVPGVREDESEGVIQYDSETGEQVLISDVNFESPNDNSPVAVPDAAEQINQIWETKDSPLDQENTAEMIFIPTQSIPSPSQIRNDDDSNHRRVLQLARMPLDSTTQKSSTLSPESLDNSRSMSENSVIVTKHFSEIESSFSKSENKGEDVSNQFGDEDTGDNRLPESESVSNAVSQYPLYSNSRTVDNAVSVIHSSSSYNSLTGNNYSSLSAKLDDNRANYNHDDSLVTNSFTENCTSDQVFNRTSEDKLSNDEDSNTMSSQTSGLDLTKNSKILYSGPHSETIRYSEELKSASGSPTDERMEEDSNISVGHISSKASSVIVPVDGELQNDASLENDSSSAGVDMDVSDLEKTSDELFIHCEEKESSLPSEDMEVDIVSNDCIKLNNQKELNPINNVMCDSQNVNTASKNVSSNKNVSLISDFICESRDINISPVDSSIDETAVSKIIPNFQNMGAVSKNLPTVKDISQSIEKQKSQISSECMLPKKKFRIQPDIEKEIAEICESVPNFQFDIIKKVNKDSSIIHNKNNDIELTKICSEELNKAESPENGPIISKTVEKKLSFHEALKTMTTNSNADDFKVSHNSKSLSNSLFISKEQNNTADINHLLDSNQNQSGTNTTVIEKENNTSCIDNLLISNQNQNNIKGSIPEKQENTSDNTHLSVSDQNESDTNIDTNIEANITIQPHSDKIVDENSMLEKVDVFDNTKDCIPEKQNSTSNDTHLSDSKQNESDTNIDTSVEANITIKPHSNKIADENSIQEKVDVFDLTVEDNFVYPPKKTYTSRKQKLNSVFDDESNSDKFSRDLFSSSIEIMDCQDKNADNKLEASKEILQEKETVCCEYKKVENSTDASKEIVSEKESTDPVDDDDFISPIEIKVSANYTRKRKSMPSVVTEIRTRSLRPRLSANNDLAEGDKKIDSKVDSITKEKESKADSEELNWANILLQTSFQSPSCSQSLTSISSPKKKLGPKTKKEKPTKLTSEAQWEKFMKSSSPKKVKSPEKKIREKVKKQVRTLCKSDKFNSQLFDRSPSEFSKLTKRKKSLKSQQNSPNACKKPAPVDSLKSRTSRPTKEKSMNNSATSVSGLNRSNDKTPAVSTVNSNNKVTDKKDFNCSNCSFSTSKVNNLINHLKYCIHKEPIEKLNYRVDDMDRRQRIRGEDASETSSRDQNKNYLSNGSTEHDTSEPSCSSTSLECSLDDSDDDAEDKKEKIQSKFGCFEEKSAVWVQRGRRFWPAVVWRFRKGKVFVFLIKSSTTCEKLKVTVNQLRTFDDSKMTNKFLKQANTFSDKDDYIKAVQKCQSYLNKVCIRGKKGVDMRQFFQIPDNEEFSDSDSECQKKQVMFEEHVYLDPDTSSEEDIGKHYLTLKPKAVSNYILQNTFDDRLLAIYNKKIYHENHKKFFSKSDEDRLQSKQTFGPYHKDSSMEKIFNHLEELFSRNIGDEPFKVPYIYEVWIPEVLTKAMSVVKNITLEEAETIFYSIQVDSEAKAASKRVTRGSRKKASK